MWGKVLKVRTIDPLDQGIRRDDRCCICNLQTQVSFLQGVGVVEEIPALGGGRPSGGNVPALPSEDSMIQCHQAKPSHSLVLHSFIRSSDLLCICLLWAWFLFLTLSHWPGHEEGSCGVVSFVSQQQLLPVLGMQKSKWQSDLFTFPFTKLGILPHTLLLYGTFLPSTPLCHF